MDASTLNSTTEALTNLYNTSSSGPPQTISPLVKLGYTTGALVTTVGICANAVVFGVLVRGRRQHASNVNTLIINQSLMDLMACFFIAIYMVLNATGRFVYNRSRTTTFADQVVCILFHAGAFPGSCMNAGKVGLVVITLERYVKIVHAIAHRKHYRGWMTSVAAAVPWISGVCWALFPALGTTRIVNGTCHRLAFWPNKAMASVSILRLYCGFSIFPFIKVYLRYRTIEDSYFFIYLLCSHSRAVLSAASLHSVRLSRTPIFSKLLIYCKHSVGQE